MLACILVGLAEREAQVIAVDERRVGRRLFGAHARDFLLQEAVRLEVRQTPVRIAVVRPRSGGGAVGLDRLGAAAESLERMRDRKMQVRRPRRPDEEIAVQRNRLVVFAETDAGGGVKRAVLAIFGLELEELLELRARLLVLVALDEHQRVVVARG